jgi:hypothetical protein
MKCADISVEGKLLISIQFSLFLLPTVPVIEFQTVKTLVVIKKRKYFDRAQTAQSVGSISYNQVTVLFCGLTLVEGNFHNHMSTVRLHVGSSTPLSSFYK